MTATIPNRAPTSLRHRPKTLTVFAAAFIAGAAVAVGVNRALDVHLAQSKPQVECEPIFVALRSLSQGSPVTVWDVALRDWPKAMVPSTALKSHDTFEGQLLRHPLREGQPLLSVQLIRAAASTTNVTDPTVIEQPFAPPPPAPAAADVADAGDSWLPGPAAPTATAGTERPARIAAGPQPQTVQPTTTPTTAAPVELTFQEPPRAEPAAADTPKPIEQQPAEPAAITPPVAATPSPQPELLPAVEPQAIPPAQRSQSTSRTDVPDAVAAATPPSPELVPYPTSPAPQPPATQPSVPTPADDAVTPAPPTDAAQTAVPVAPAPTSPTPAADAEAPTAATAAATPSATAPSPVEPPADAAAANQQTPELRTVLAQNPTGAPRADAAAPQPAAEAPNRYLVVPERIALQADVSFVNPQPREAASDEPTTEAQPSSPPTRQTSRQPKPQPQQASSAKQPTAAGRLPGRSGPAVRSPAAPRASGGATRQLPGSTQPSPTKRPTTAATPQASMFPNIAAGIDALTGGFKRTRDEQRTTAPR